ncbi:hypothetical protein [Sodalis ligni]|uniref:Uncharacterized protein n=1 Tax=Sodalis ligni TaxID=2697027 RepID=A0A4R1NGR4_9GAMM|nr:hypothetical protein [Sodalis ligni]TCL06895.1 hypothetical protein EZJ58_5192 [Sodalis ligni]
MKFIEIVGNASTTAFRNGKNLGHNVNVSAYENGDNIMLYVESNGSRVNQIRGKSLSRAEYEDFCEQNRRNLSIHALNSMGCTTVFNDVE